MTDTNTHLSNFIAQVKPSQTIWALQDKASAALLDSIELQNYTVNGDTRFDRVISIMEEAEEIPDVRDFVGGKPCIVLGSSWPQEEMRILSFLDRHDSEDFKVIIAPHEIKASRHRSHLGLIH